MITLQTCESRSLKWRLGNDIGDFMEFKALTSNECHLEETSQQHLRRRTRTGHETPSCGHTVDLKVNPINHRLPNLIESKLTWRQPSPQNVFVGNSPPGPSLKVELVQVVGDLKSRLPAENVHAASGNGGREITARRWNLLAHLLDLFPLLGPAVQRDLPHVV